MVSGFQDDYNGSVCVHGVELGRGGVGQQPPWGVWSIQWSCCRPECQGLGVPTLSAVCVCPERKDLPFDEAALRS